MPGVDLPKAKAGPVKIEVGALAFADDLMVVGHDREELEERLAIAWAVARDIGMRFNPAKCEMWPPYEGTGPVRVPDYDAGPYATTTIKRSESIYYLGQFLGNPEPMEKRYLDRFRRRVARCRVFLASRKVSFRTSRLLFLMVCRASVEYATFIGTPRDEFWKQAEMEVRRARRWMLSVSRGTLELALENESGIKPLRQRAADLGSSYAWGVDERLTQHQDNPLMEFLWELTRDARAKSEALHARWERDRQLMFHKRKARALPDVFAAPVSFAAYLGLDYTWRNREWREDVRKRLRELVAEQRARGIEDAASTAEKYLSTSSGL